MTDYETAVIPDVDIEESLHKVLINNEEYYIGKTGNIYHSDRYIIGKIVDWEDTIELSKGEEISVKVKPIVGHEKILKPSRRDKFKNKRIKK